MATFARLARACLAATCLALSIVIVATPSPAGAVEAKESATKEKRAPTPGQLAARERMKTCGAEWRALKAAGNTGSRTWREFSSACMKQAKR